MAGIKDMCWRNTWIGRGPFLNRERPPARRTVGLKSQERDTGRRTGVAGFVIPQGTLHLSDMGFAQKQHADPGLADAASDRQGQFAV